MALTLEMPLVDDLSLTVGTGPATFTRSTTATYVDKDDGLVKTAAIDVARFETNGVLIEGASTNLALQSEDYTNAAWAKLSGAIVTGNQATAPDGTLTADEVDISAQASSRVSFSVASVPAGTYTYSVYVKALSGQSGTYPVVMILAGTGGSVNILDVPITDSEWVRATITDTQTGVGNVTIYVGENNSPGNTLEVAYVWGAQLEELPFASSYIPTTSSSVTRTADDLSIPPSNIPAPTLDYSVSADVDVIGAAGIGQEIFSVSGEVLRFMQAQPNLVNVRSRHGGSNAITSSSVPANTTISITSAIDVSDSTTGQKVYFNSINEAIGAVTSVTGTKTAVVIGNRGLNYLFGHIKDFRIYDAAIVPGLIPKIMNSHRHRRI